MTKQTLATIDIEKLKTKELHDLMLAVPVKDGFCRFYGGYVAVGGEACFPDRTIHKCVATETFEPTGKTC